MTKVLTVVAAALINADGKILLAQGAAEEARASLIEEARAASGGG